MYFKKLIFLLLIAIVVLPLGSVEANTDEKSGEFLFTRTGWDAGNKISEIYKFNLDTASLSKVVDGYDPDIFPDGKNIAFVRDVKTLSFWYKGELVWDYQSDLFISDIGGKGHKNLTNSRYYLETSPKISPDGKVISYTRNHFYDSWRAALCFIDVDGTNNWCLDETWPDELSCDLPDEEQTKSCLTHTKSNINLLFDISATDKVWVPTQKEPNTQVLLLSSGSFWTERKTKNEIFAIELEDTVLKSVRLVGKGLFPSVTKDGLTMFFQNNNAAYRSGIDGLELKKLLDILPVDRLWPSDTLISPNEDKLVYKSETHVRLANIDGSGDKPIFWDGNTISDVYWTPDGNLIYCKRDKTTNTLSLYLYDMETSKTTRITYPPNSMERLGGDDSVVFFP